MQAYTFPAGLYHRLSTEAAGNEMRGVRIEFIDIIWNYTRKPFFG